MGLVDTGGAPPCFVPIVDEEGFIIVGGVKVCRIVPERGTLQFFDKDKRRTDRRGCHLVEVRIKRLDDLLR